MLAGHSFLPTCVSSVKRDKSLDVYVLLVRDFWSTFRTSIRNYTLGIICLLQAFKAFKARIFSNQRETPTQIVNRIGHYLERNVSIWPTEYRCRSILWKGCSSMYFHHSKHRQHRNAWAENWSSITDLNNLRSPNEAVAMMLIMCYLLSVFLAWPVTCYR